MPLVVHGFQMVLLGSMKFVLAAHYANFQFLMDFSFSHIV